VAEAFDAFVARCDGGEYGGTCVLAYGDGRSEVLAVTVDQEGCWFAQLTEGSALVGPTPIGRPVRRGCAD